MRSCRMTTCSTVELKKHTTAGAIQPMVQFFRTRWPDPAPETAEAAEPVNLPERTVPDEHLMFTLKFSNQPGTTIFYPHLTTNPKDRKVVLEVFMKHLGLTKLQERIFIQLVGPRYNAAGKKVKLVCDQFQNRIENKRYLLVILENLKLEAQRLSELNI